MARFTRQNQIDALIAQHEAWLAREATEGRGTSRDRRYDPDTMLAEPDARRIGAVTQRTLRANRRYSGWNNTGRIVGWATSPDGEATQPPTDGVATYRRIWPMALVRSSLYLGDSLLPSLGALRESHRVDAEVQSLAHIVGYTGDPTL